MAILMEVSLVTDMGMDSAMRTNKLEKRQRKSLHQEEIPLENRLLERVQTLLRTGEREKRLRLKKQRRLQLKTSELEIKP